MISKELEIAFATAIREAKTRHHEMLTVEHILYALLHDPVGSRILRNCGADIKELKQQLEDFFSRFFNIDTIQQILLEILPYTGKCPMQ